MRFETAAIHAGQEPEPRTGAVTVPIFQTSTYAQPGVGEHTGYEYSRTQNPTREAMQDCLAALEGGKYGLAFGSGMAATTTMMSLLKQGDHVVSSADVYGGTYRVFEKVFRDFGLDYTFVDSSSLDNVEKAMKPSTRMIWLETPSNPLLDITDLSGAAALARQNDCITVVDNTFASPFFQKPLSLGIDVVVHSATKFLGGHSDVVLGVLATSNEQVHERLAFSQNAMGAVAGPFDCWLVLRGMKTLAVRMERHEQNAKAIVDWLGHRPEVTKILYPGLESFPGHALAKEQMSGFGSMISFYVSGGVEMARGICEKTKIFTLAESLGGVESLIEHPGIMTHASIPEEIRTARGLGDDLVRLSVGIEHVDDLIADLEQAF